MFRYIYMLIIAIISIDVYGESKKSFILDNVGVFTFYPNRIELHSINNYIESRRANETGRTTYSCIELGVDYNKLSEEYTKNCNERNITGAWNTLELIKYYCNEHKGCIANVVNADSNNCFIKKYKFVTIFKEQIEKCKEIKGSNSNIAKLINDYETAHRVRLYYYRVYDRLGSLKVSVWKNKEGEFNTVRLISDTSAGVVLGTVSGIVTSVLIKKNQVKKGYEDMKCYVGGQVVADYKDEFVVGIK